MLSTLRMKYVKLFQTNPQRVAKLNFGHSSKNISIATDRQYKEKLVKKKEAVIKGIWWKTFYSEQNDTRNNIKNIYYGLKYDKKPPFMKLLDWLEKDLFNDSHMEELALYWIQYKNSLKKKLLTFFMSTKSMRFFQFHYRTDVWKTWFIK